MKNRKILGIIFVIVVTILVASIVLGSVAADDTKEITVGKVKFKIPNGFEENKTKEMESGTIITRYVNGDEFISLSVHSGEDKITKISTDDEGSVEKEIAGKNGIYKAKSHKFTYVTEDQKTSIVVMCDSDKTLEDFLKLN